MRPIETFGTAIAVSHTEIKGENFVILEEKNKDVILLSGKSHENWEQLAIPKQVLPSLFRYLSDRFARQIEKEEQTNAG